MNWVDKPLCIGILGSSHDELIQIDLARFVDVMKTIFKADGAPAKINFERISEIEMTSVCQSDFEKDINERTPLLSRKR